MNIGPGITGIFLPEATIGSIYTGTLQASGGTPPLTFSMVFGALPPGLAFNGGTVSGTPTAGGTWYFTAVVDDKFGDGSSQVVGISVGAPATAGNPVPSISQPLVPDAVAPGTAGFTLTVNGTGFVSGASVDFNGVAVPTTFISGNQLKAAVTAADVASADTASISVVNPTPRGGSFNVLFLPVALQESSLNFASAPNSPITIASPVNTSAPICCTLDSLAVGDFTGAGKQDLAIGNAGGFNDIVLLGNGDGTFTQAPGSPVTPAAPPWNASISESGPIALGDFNNSGHLGIIAANEQAISVSTLLGNGNGTFTPSNAIVFPSANPDFLVAGDFNGDGYLDFAASNSFGGVDILTGYGDGAFTELSDKAISVYSPAAMTAGNFGSGKLGLAIASDALNAPGAVVVLNGNGDGTFTQATGSPITIGTNPSAIAAADFNGDGKLDLAITNAADNTVTILLGSGDGTFTPAPGSPISVGSSPGAIAVGDLLGNGKLDLVVANFGSNNITIMLGNRDGTFTQAANSPFPVGKAPTAIALADFNGDGRLDIAVANLGAGTLSILLQQ